MTAPGASLGSWRQITTVNQGYILGVLAGTPTLTGLRGGSGGGGGGDDGELRGFQNACGHRGNALCSGSGSGLTELRCGYHRWAWDLQGQLREVPSRKGFGVIRNDDLPLFPVQVDTWGRLVFVNLDLDAAPLADWLEGVTPERNSFEKSPMKAERPPSVGPLKASE